MKSFRSTVAVLGATAAMLTAGAALAQPVSSTAPRSTAPAAAASTAAKAPAAAAHSARSNHSRSHGRAPAAATTTTPAHAAKK